MKWIGSVCVVLMMAGVAAFRMPGDRVDAVAVAALTDEAPPALVPAPGPGVAAEAPVALADQSAPALVATPQVAVRGGAPSSGSRRRFRRRDRYWLDMTFTPADWAPPEGAVRIGLQAGHWKANEAPDELSGLRDNGTRANGKAEWEVNLDIARRAAGMLEELGYIVDVLPAVVPPSYRAHLFISIHADGSADPAASGFRVAPPRRDATGRAGRAAELLERSYGEATGLSRLPAVTRRMSNYYAFNYRRYQHALHPLTIGVILETGFLTSAADRRVIVEDPARAARGIVAAVTAFPETPPPAIALPVASGSGG